LLNASLVSQKAKRYSEKEKKDKNGTCKNRWGIL